MKFDEETMAKYSLGSLLKKRSCKGRTIRIEILDVATAERINRRVANTSKQLLEEEQKSKILADETYANY